MRQYGVRCLCVVLDNPVRWEMHVCGDNGHTAAPAAVPSAHIEAEPEARWIAGRGRMPSGCRGWSGLTYESGHRVRRDLEVGGSGVSVSTVPRVLTHCTKVCGKSYGEVVFMAGPACPRGRRRAA